MKHNIWHEGDKQCCYCWLYANKKKGVFYLGDFHCEKCAKELDFQ